MSKLKIGDLVTYSKFRSLRILVITELPHMNSVRIRKLNDDNKYDRVVNIKYIRLATELEISNYMAELISKGE